MSWLTVPDGVNELRARGRTTGLILLLLLLAGLVSYKSAGALRTLDVVRTTGSLAVRSDVVPLVPGASLSAVAQSLNYLAVVWPALVFGILIAGAVRAFVPASMVAQFFERGPVRSHLAAGVAGSPLMLCSCCVAPVFSAVYERSTRLGPSLAVMLAAPALNPAALILTFALFPPLIAWSRLSMSVAAVFAGTALIALVCGNRVVPQEPMTRGQGEGGIPALAGRSAVPRLLWSCAHVAVKTIPLIAMGVAVGMLIAGFLSPQAVISPHAAVVTIAVTAAIAVPVALPTFFEIPLALALLAAGAPAGAAAALLFAGPAVNLPSLLTIARSAGWRATLLVAAMVWLVACAGGVLIS